MTELKPINELLPDSPNKRGRERPSPDDEVTLQGKDELVLALVEVGISLRKAEHLVAKYPESRIRRQLMWLPKRTPRRPASLLIAAIERDFDAPAYDD